MEVLSADLREWIVPGLAGAISIVDSEGAPLVSRMWAARVLDGSAVIEIYVQRSSALPLLEALAIRRRAALNLIEVTTYRARMFKGWCELSPLEADAAFVEESLAAASRAFQAVGLPHDGVERMLSYGEPPRAMVALRLEVESAFDQSPKRGAGARL